MKGIAGGGTEPRVSFSEMREGARKQGEAEWADGVRVSAYIFLRGDYFHPPMQRYTSAVQRAKGVPELSRKAGLVSRVFANVRRKQHRHQTTTVQQLHPGLASQHGCLMLQGLAKQPAIASAASGALCPQIFMKRRGGFKHCQSLPPCYDFLRML